MNFEQKNKMNQNESTQINTNQNEILFFFILSKPERPIYKN